MTAAGFFTELQKLIFAQPNLPSSVMNTENCDFCSEVYNSKNLSYCFDTYSTTDSFYMFDSFMCADSGDCDYAVESELCYESVDPFKCFNCNFTEYCANSRDLDYCVRCFNSNDMFGCVNLSNKSFCIFNRQLTENEYREKIVEFKKMPPEKVLTIVEELKKKFPLTQTIEAYNDNTYYGNYIHYDKNCYLCFDAAHDENCSYLYDSFYCTNSLDLTYTGHNELTYQALDSSNLFNCNFAIHSTNCQDSSYLFRCFNVKNSLGCISLKNKEYCILNRQFTKEQYEQISGQILQELRTQDFEWSNLVYLDDRLGKIT